MLTAMLEAKKIPYACFCLQAGKKFIPYVLGQIEGTGGRNYGIQR